MAFLVLTYSAPWGTKRLPVYVSAIRVPASPFKISSVSNCPYLIRIFSLRPSRNRLSAMLISSFPSLILSIQKQLNKLSTV